MILDLLRRLSDWQTVTYQSFLWIHLLYWYVSLFRTHYYFFHTYFHAIDYFAILPYCSIIFLYFGFKSHSTEPLVFSHFKHYAPRAPRAAYDGRIELEVEAAAQHGRHFTPYPPIYCASGLIISPWLLEPAFSTLFFFTRDRSSFFIIDWQTHSHLIAHYHQLI
jgi:hypothetical protein